MGLSDRLGSSLSLFFSLAVLPASFISIQMALYESFFKDIRLSIFVSGSYDILRLTELDAKFPPNKAFAPFFLTFQSHACIS